MCNHVYDEREKVNEKKKISSDSDIFSLQDKIYKKKNYDEDEISVEIESENIMKNQLLLILVCVCSCFDDGVKVNLCCMLSVIICFVPIN